MLKTFLSVFEELRRSPIRPALAAGGMMVGVMALICVGSLAWTLRSVSREAARNNTEIVAAVDRDVLSYNKADDFLHGLVKAVQTAPGVSSTDTMLMLPYRLDVDFTRLLPPETVLALRPEVLKQADVALRDDEAALGADFAAVEDLRVRDDMAIYGNLLHVVKVFPRRYSYVDQSVTITESAGRLLLPQLSDHRAKTGLHAGRPFTVIRVAVKTPAEMDRVILALNAIPHLTAQDPREYARLVSGALGVLLFVSFGTLAITLLTALAAIGNTMASAVAARRAEIGIKRAIGATRRDIFAEIALEAVAQGAAGGIFGVALSLVVEPLFQPLERTVGSSGLFHVQPAVAGMAVMVAILSAAAAGLIPAIHASQLQPATAIRTG